MTSSILFTSVDMHDLYSEIGRPSLMGRTITGLQQQLDIFMQKKIYVPMQGEAGGKSHHQHKQNGYYINLAGQLYAITKNIKYAEFCSFLLTEYSNKYRLMDYYVQYNTNPPGKLFHQILNEQMWLLYASLGYSCIADYLPEINKKHIITSLFEPMLDMFVNKYRLDFDRIHNHGIWAVAAVGICAIAINKQDVLDCAVNGLNGDKVTGGFLAQLSQLFASSGYYVEGPYYHRFAMQPLCLFAEALYQCRPEIDIFNYNNQIIKKTTLALLAMAYPNGVFPALNDASRTMAVTDIGIQIAVSMYTRHYGFDPRVLGVAKIQDQVWLHPYGYFLSKKLEEEVNIPPHVWHSVELDQGVDGRCGAQGILRMQGDDGDMTQLIMDYGQHGMGHGHFDSLGICFYNSGQEVLTEYGFVRWVNIEPKFGGRYLPENNSYAKQTIAHNNITIDQCSQSHAHFKQADQNYGLKHFFVGNDLKTDVDYQIQAMSAFSYDHYPDSKMQRSVFLFKNKMLNFPLMIDVFRIISDCSHQYDYSHHYNGQIIRTNFAYNYNNKLYPLGNQSGYQHLWSLAQAKIKHDAMISWLQGSRFYSWIGDCDIEDHEIIFTHLGANDSSFNLRHEPGFIMRAKGKNVLFSSVIETHGYFNESNEQSIDALGECISIKILAHTSVGSVVKILADSFVVILMVSNQLDVTEATMHNINTNDGDYCWTGYFSVKQELLL